MRMTFHRNLGCFLLAAFLASVTAVKAQDTEVQTVPLANYSYQVEVEGQLVKREFDLLEVAGVLKELEFGYTPISALTDEHFESLARHELTRPLAEGWALGGMSAGAAAVILSVTSIGEAECAKLGMVIHGTPMLGRSSMVAVQNAQVMGSNDGLGRGQFDIRTTKFVLCRDELSNKITGVPINVRWVFNVNGDSLKTKIGPQKGPNGKDYMQNFHAEGIGIELVLLEVNGEVMPEDSPVYKSVPDACIDIFFVEEVKTPDI